MADDAASKSGRPRAPNFGARRVQDTPVVIEGFAYCRDCHSEGVRRPNHPDHPRSPYCEEHYASRRAAAQRAWRVKRRDIDRANRSVRSGQSDVARAGDGSVVLSAIASAELRVAMKWWAEQVTEAREAMGFLSEGLPRGKSDLLRQTADQLGTNLIDSIQGWLALFDGDADYTY